MRVTMPKMPALRKGPFWMKEQLKPQMSPTGTASRSETHDTSFSGSLEKVFWRGALAAGSVPTMVTQSELPRTTLF